MKKFVLMTILCLGLCCSVVSANSSGISYSTEAGVKKTEVSTVTSSGSTHYTVATNLSNYQIVGAKTEIVNLSSTEWSYGSTSATSAKLSTGLTYPVHYHYVVGATIT